MGEERDLTQARQGTSERRTAANLRDEKCEQSGGERSPIPIVELRNLIHRSVAEMSQAERRLWDLLRIVPEKWALPPWGDEVGGFWALGLLGRHVIWYKGIEGGFNISRYTRRGTIDNDLCNQGSLQPVRWDLLHQIETGEAPGAFEPQRPLSELACPRAPKEQARAARYDRARLSRGAGPLRLVVRRRRDEVDFGQLFIQSRRAPIQHDGKTLIMLDRLPAKLGDKFTVTLETTRSLYPQGVGISEGVQVFGERVKRVVIWEYFSLPPELRQSERSRLPFSFEVVCRNKKGSLSFYNMTEVHGHQSWWHGGSCMIAEDIPGGRRYRCNDFELDDDFDDLVFSVVKDVSPNKALHLARRV
jgi:hypothetical protein